MLVAFDTSILGRAQLLPLARSGIYRYADNLLQALAESRECQLLLTSFGYSLDVAGLAEYRDQRPALQHFPVKVNPAIRSVGSGLRHLLRASQNGSGGPTTRSGILRRAHQMGDGFLATLQQSRPSLLARQLSGAQLFHTPFLHIPEALRTLPGTQRCVTVHDLNPIVYPQHFPTIVRRWSNKVMDNIRRDDWVLAVSNYVKEDLCARYNVDSERVRVTYLAADPDQFQPCRDAFQIADVRRRYRIPDGPYLLSLGSLSPHKNIGHLVNCFAELVKQQGIHDLNLVLAGAEGWMVEGLADSKLLLGSAADRIIQTGYVDDADQAALYSGATAFIFPSLCEGFGLPPLEAMQCGTPVICANATSLPEVVGTAGILVSPHDSDGLCQAMLNLYRDQDLCLRLRDLGLARAKNFTWSRCAQETLACYREALV